MAVLGTITTTKLDVADGVTSSGFRLVLTETTTGATLTGVSATTTITIEAVPAGTYVGSVVALDQAGAPIGPVVTAAETVTVAQANQIDVPASLTLSVV